MIIVSGFFSISTAQQSRFDEANLLLEENEFREAIQLYRGIAENGYHSGALWLNTGIAYSQIDSLGMAKYYFLKAERYPETKELAQNALAYVNDRFSRRSAVLPPLPWDRFFETLSDRYGVTGLVLFGLFFLYAGVSLIIAGWFFNGAKKIYRYSGLTAILLCSVIFLSAVYVNYQESRYSTAVMVERQSRVYESPDETASVISTAYEGYTMRIDHIRGGEHSEWHYVRLENGMYGWITESSIMVL